MNIGIIGHGFVGKAIEFAFTNPQTNIHIIDPKYNTDIDTMYKNFSSPDVIFICVPTPMSGSGMADASIVLDCVDKVNNLFSCLIVIKSTIPPNIVNDITQYISNKRFIYNPEFLTERSSISDFIEADHHILGGSDIATDKLVSIYKNYSSCSADEYLCMTPAEASFVKYAVNSYLATKVTFFNQLYDVVENFDCSYNKIAYAVSKDKRIGSSHTKVPGFDFKRGFGGACLPKDISAFIEMSNGYLELLSIVMLINNNYRKAYDKDEREKSNNITFGTN